MAWLITLWVACIPFSLLFAVGGRILAPGLAFFCDDEGWLPNWLNWFQTPDNSCDGDAGHRARWPRDGVFWTYARRVAWLLRNVGYGFDIQVLGIEIEETDKITISGNTNIGDLSGISGKCFWLALRDEKPIAFQWMYVKHYKLFCKWPKCIRIGMGWKIWNEKPSVAQYWLYFNPIK